ncbi:Uncharacterised protein [Serratia quinivorans]|jgi:hypothetical protein|uniref:Uncharacterized protein n=3 Tax=Serratia TaxID=613 RepID=A0A380B0M2_9GAMM|nr:MULTISPECIES: hypothetical protein [Serratia]RYM57354.1 hypothetical protein BSR03_26160 [Serratia proteamaculans]CAI1496244.1 Uncharacterised protein [Serratia quinivorans]CAI1509422.1 Uncharacterised protein [Serratia quinivorans]CAI1648012.1 Uncharacterised protein [Serratia quinivorans]CAI1796080.1 Uncharacterised protein [Serratia quinivorans]
MLTTALQQSVKIATDKYLGIKEYAFTCYGDSIDKNIYYVVPEIPVFVARDTKSPYFMFYKYRSEDTQGGYAQFTVMLPQPDSEMKKKISIELLGKLKDPLIAKSTLIVKYVQAEQASVADPENATKKTAMDTALRNTGLNDDQAARFVALYDSNQGNDQFVPELTPIEIKLEVPRLTSAHASLILDSNEKFYRQIPTTVSPSGLGDNNTVFSLSLTGEGATLFEQVLKGTDTNSSVGIRFDFSLDASLPAAKVTVSYDSEITKSVTQNITYHTWSADEKKIEREYIEKGAIKVDVQTGLSYEEMGMTEDQYLKWKEGLTAWGQKQVEQILSSQTGLDMSLELLNDADGFDKFKSSLSETKSFTRVYEENSVVSFSIAPQTQLPSIQSIVGEENLKDYFKEYDLNDPFYQYIQPEFFVTQDLAKYNVANIVVTAIYDKDNQSTLQFSPGDSEPKKTGKWFINPELGRAFKYSYTVNFTGMQAKPYHSGELQSDQDLVISINVAECGIVYADISTLLDPMGWKVFSQVVIKTQYSDPDKGVKIKTDSQVVSESTPPHPFIYPIGVDVDKPIYFSTDYYALDGDSLTYIPDGVETSPQLPGYGLIRGHQILVANALPKAQKYTIIFKPSQKEITLITYEMVVYYPKWDFTQSQSLALTEFDSKSLTQYLTFNLMQAEKDNKVEIHYVATVYYGEDNQEKTVEKEVTGTSTIVVVTF